MVLSCFNTLSENYFGVLWTLIMKLFGLSSLLKLSVLILGGVSLGVCVYIYMFSNELILWFGHFRYFCLIGKFMQSLITTVENLYAACSSKKYVAAWSILALELYNTSFIIPWL